MAQRYTLIQRFLLAAAAVACCAGGPARAQTPSLKDAYKNDFRIGAALGGTLPDDYTEAELAVIKSQFNAVTPENCMKPESLHPAEDQWYFAQSDALVEFAEAN